MTPANAPGSARLVELVLIGVLVVLQEDLNLVVHLLADVLAAERGKDADNAKRQRREARRPQSNDVALLESSRGGPDDLGRNARDLRERGRAQRECGEDRRDGRLREAGADGCGRDQLHGLVALHVGEDGSVNGDGDGTASESRDATGES